MPSFTSRRHFLRFSAGAALLTPSWFHILRRAARDPIIGHGAYRYRINANWSKAVAAKNPVKDCHEMAIDKKQRIFLLTNNTRNNVLIYNKDGVLLDAWGTAYPGAHGLTLFDENGTEYLYISDYDRHEVFKTTLEGRLVQRFSWPADSGKYASQDAFKPTEIAIAPNSDVYVADGYGLDYIVHYSPDGKLKNIFGGKGQGAEHLNNAHGIALDLRKPENPTLLATSRVENALKRYTLDGKYLQTISVPGAYLCRPVVHGREVYSAVLVSRMPWDSQSGFVLVLDENDRVVAAPGGSTPQYAAGQLETPLYQTVKAFKHPHDVLVDDAQNIYVAQWNAGNVYPMRLERV